MKNHFKVGNGIPIQHGQILPYLVGDLLLKWETTPGNALFIGYGTFRDEYDDLRFARQSIDRGKSFFLKFSSRYTQ